MFRTGQVKIRVPPILPSGYQVTKSYHALRSRWLEKMMNLRNIISMVPQVLKLGRSQLFWFPRWTIITAITSRGKLGFFPDRSSGAMSTILPSVDALLGIRNTSANRRCRAARRDHVSCEPLGHYGGFKNRLKVSQGDLYHLSLTDHDLKESSPKIVGIQ